MTSTAPVRSMPEVDRAAASKRAIEMRRARAAIKDALVREGGWVELLELTADPAADEAARSMRVTEFIMTVPNVGPMKRDRILRECDMSARKRLGGLGRVQRANLARIITNVLAGNGVRL